MVIDLERMRHRDAFRIDSLPPLTAGQSEKGQTIESPLQGHTVGPVL